MPSAFDLCLYEQRNALYIDVTNAYAGALGRLGEVLSS